MTFRTITIVILILPRVQGHRCNRNCASSNSHGSKRGSNRLNHGLSPIRGGNHQKMSCGSRRFSRSSRMSNETLAGKHIQDSRTPSSVRPCQKEHHRRGPVAKAPAGRNNDRILLASRHRDPNVLLLRHPCSEPRPRPRPLHGSILHRSARRPAGTETACQIFRSRTKPNDSPRRDGPKGRSSITRQGRDSILSLSRG